MEIHVVHGDEESGPYNLDEVQRLLSVNALHPNDLAWHVGLSDWQPLHMIAGVSIPEDPYVRIQPPPLPDRITIYVGFWRRLGAVLIDGVLVTMITLPILLKIYGWEYFDEDSPLIMGSADLILSHIFPGIATVLFWIWKQATPGKMIVSAKIVDAITLEKPPASRLILRYLAYMISALPLGLGFLWAAFDPRKQGWHDKLAGTVVVRDPEGSLEEAFK